MRHATIIDIAKRLRISPSTVSRALRDHPDIKQETKELVRQIAAELHYSPNPIAQSLKSNRTTTIGVMVPEIKHDFFSSAISGIEEIAYRSGYTIILCQSNESLEREVVNANVLMHHRVAGLVVSISQSTRSGAHFEDLLRRKIPVVFFDRVCADVEASKVVTDDYKSAFDAVTFLAGRGYKKIAHFAGPRELEMCKLRLNGYMEALKHAGLPALSNLICFGGLHEQDGYSSLSVLLQRNELPDAILGINDPVAIGAYQKIKESGLKIPGDVALVGFSNNKITSLIDPPMTTVEQPSFDMGKRAAELLIDEIEGRLCKPVTVVLDGKLIIREST
jgi:DNA-binding LacI/PurR family transcriptional regulator